MMRLKKVVHHSCSATGDHQECESIMEWCKVRTTGNINYKSNKFTIKDEPQILPVSKEGNRIFMIMFERYWDWAFVKAVIWGKKTNGTQSCESFNHVRCKFTNKYTSTKDPDHYEGQSYSAVLQYNDGFKSMGYKLRDWGIELLPYQEKLMRDMDIRRKRTYEYHTKDSFKKKRKYNRLRVKEIDDGQDEYQTNGYIKTIE